MGQRTETNKQHTHHRKLKRCATRTLRKKQEMNTGAREQFLFLIRQPLCYSYNHCVTHTTIVLLLQPLCYSYNHCVTPTTIVLLIQPLCYSYNHCVTHTTIVLLLQPLCYSYNHCVTHTTIVLLMQLIKSGRILVRD